MDEAKYAATVVTDTNMNNGIGKVIDALLAGKEGLTQRLVIE